jgi:hypothetical protein
MTSPCLTTVTREDAVLDAAPGDIEPLLVNEHLHPCWCQTLGHRAAVAIMTAGQTGSGEQVLVDVMSLHRPRPNHQKTTDECDLFWRHDLPPDYRVAPGRVAPGAQESRARGCVVADYGSLRLILFGLNFGAEAVASPCNFA